MKKSICWTVLPICALFIPLALAADSLPSLDERSDSAAALSTGSTLEDFFTGALRFSPRLRIAEEALNIGSSRRQAARGRLLPQVNANASISDNRRIAANGLEKFDGQRYSVQLTQVLFNWRAFAAKDAANFVEYQLEAEYYSELSNVLTEVSEKYFNVLQAQDALESIAGELEAVSQQLEQVESLYSRQLAQITDLYRAQASLAAVEAEQLNLQSTFELSKEALRAVSGLEVSELYSLSEEASIPPLSNSINYMVNQAEQNNHQIVAQEFAVKAADKIVDQQRGAYMPEVSFVIQRQDSDVGFDNIAVPRTENTYVGLNVTIPLYAGGSNKAGVREAISQQRIAENELRQIQLEASERVRTAYLQVESAETLIEAANKLVESTSLSSLAMQRGFELGAVTSVDVLNALRDQYRAERDLQRARYEQIKYLLLLKRETGTLTADDLLEVSSWLEAPEN